MHFLLTGATGLVGQYLLRDLLLEGQDVAVVVRSQRRMPARERLEAIVGRWEGELGRPLRRPVCLEGDMSLAGIGLTCEARAWIARHCRSVVHNAASLTFIGKDRTQEPWLSNFTGTANVLELCREIGIRDLHYMSTAYVCGKRSGLIGERELDCGQDFRNDYEECKFEAEKLVRAADFLHTLTVYRPAVIVGDSLTGYTASYHGFYAFIQYIWLVVQLLPLDPDGRLHYPMRLNLTGDERRNFVPVDWVSAVTTRVLLDRRHHGRTYHLTPPQPLVGREVVAALARYFNFYGPVYVGPGELDAASMNEYENMYYGYLARYDSYGDEDLLFDCRNTQAVAADLPCPRIDEACLHRLIDFAIRDRFGKRKERKREQVVPLAG